MSKKLNAYIFNNYEHEDIYLCDEHDSTPRGMWVKTQVDEDSENDIVCQKCGETMKTSQVPDTFRVTIIKT